MLIAIGAIYHTDHILRVAAEEGLTHIVLYDPQWADFSEEEFGKDEIGLVKHVDGAGEPKLREKGVGYRKYTVEYQKKEFTFEYRFDRFSKERLPHEARTGEEGKTVIHTPHLLTQEDRAALEKELEGIGVRILRCD